MLRITGIGRGMYAAVFVELAIGVVEHRTTRHQGRDVSAGTTAGHHRHYGTWASALRQALVGMYPLRSDRACGTLSSRAAACRGKKPRPFARERYARSQSQSHQSPHLSALWLKLVSSIGNGHRPYGRSSSTFALPSDGRRNPADARPTFRGEATRFEPLMR